MMNAFAVKFQTLNPLIRYGIVGILNNLLGYLLYLLLTLFWLDPKVTITIFYPIGAITGYFGHLKYSFAYKGNSGATLFRYILAYVCGYGVNLMMLSILSDKLNVPHQAVQVIAIPIVAIILFIMLKYFVFTAPQIKSAT
jgi:putative flippase GtrA